MALLISILFFICFAFFIILLIKGLKRLYKEGKYNAYYASGSYLKYSIFFVFLCIILYFASLQFSSHNEISENNSINALYYHFGKDGTLYAESTHYNSTVYWISLTSRKNIHGYSVFLHKNIVEISLLKPQTHVEYYTLAKKCIIESKDINSSICHKFNNYHQIGFGNKGLLSGLNFSPMNLKLKNMKINYLNFHTKIV